MATKQPNYKVTFQESATTINVELPGRKKKIGKITVIHAKLNPPIVAKGLTYVNVRLTYSTKRFSGYFHADKRLIDGESFSEINFHFMGG